MSDTTFGEFTDVMEHPLLAQAAIEQALAEEETPTPSIPDPTDGFVRLPGGLVLGEKTYYDLEVRELTGSDEERLSKARSSSDPARWYNTLLECGVVSIGGHPAEDVLDSLLIGDREYLLLAIRTATYGDEIEMGTVGCPQCGQQVDLTVTATQVPVTRLRSVADSKFEVRMRKGGKARVRLPNGADQTAFLEDPNLTDAERNTILLSRCVVSLEVDGEETSVAAFPSLVNELGIVDRRSILKEIADRMPGPRYDEVEIEHDCGMKIPAPMGLVSLFPGL